MCRTTASANRHLPRGPKLSCKLIRDGDNLRTGTNQSCDAIRVVDAQFFSYCLTTKRWLPDALSPQATDECRTIFTSKKRGRAVFIAIWTQYLVEKIQNLQKKVESEYLSTHCVDAFTHLRGCRRTTQFSLNTLSTLLVTQAHTGMTLSINRYTHSKQSPPNRMPAADYSQLFLRCPGSRYGPNQSPRPTKKKAIP